LFIVSVYLLTRFGTEVNPVSFYAGHYQRAFPIALIDFTEATYASPAKQLASCYEVGTFERGLDWFSLVSVSAPAPGLTGLESLVSVAPLLAQLFEVLLETK
jgi:hypothetical protein